MEKNDILEKMKKEKIVSVIRGENEEEIEKIVDSIIKGGIIFIEITMTVPSAINIIEKLTKKYEGTEIIIGAGTILDSNNAELVINAGAKFVVSPILDEELIKTCNQRNILVIPGIATPTEAYKAIKYGAEIVKLFPSNIYGPDFIKAIRGPFPNIQIMPTGGISLENIDKWIEKGAIAVGIGGELTKCAKNGDYGKITELSKEFVEKVK